MSVTAIESTVPELASSLLAEPAEDGLPILLVGPSLGTSVSTLWGPSISELSQDFTVIGWDLPGHGMSPPAEKPFSLMQLTQAVMHLHARACTDSRLESNHLQYAAGVSIAGAVSLLLARSAESPFAKVASLCSAATFGNSASWHERADLVEQAGTESMVEGSAQRWFAPGFIETHAERAASLLHDLRRADRHSYAYACRALAEYDVVADLGSMRVPVLALAGEEDQVCPPDSVVKFAEAIPQSRYAQLPQVAHQAPTEAPEATAGILKEFFDG